MAQVLHLPLAHGANKCFLRSQCILSVSTKIKDTTPPMHKQSSTWTTTVMSRFSCQYTERWSSLALKPDFANCSFAVSPQIWGAPRAPCMAFFNFPTTLPLPGSTSCREGARGTEQHDGRVTFGGHKQRELDDYHVRRPSEQLPSS